jgi:uncharacterized protein (DUF58 family)
MSELQGIRFLDPKVIEKVRRLDVRARQVVEGYITGLHRSPYHGFAVEFASHREYVPGDEIKHVDWKVWSKTDRYYIKEYEEETNLKCTVILDCSKSMKYGEEGSRNKDGMGKFDYAATIAACLAYLLQRQQDSVGLVTFDNIIRRNLPASSHPSHVKLILHELDQAEPDHNTDVGDVFHRLAEQIGRRGLVVLISDLFVDLPTLVDSLNHFRHRRHEVVVFHTMHQHEWTFPFDTNTKFKGLETPEELLCEPRALRKSYLEALERFQDSVRRSCAASGIDYVPLSTADPLDAALSSYLAFRKRVARSAVKR